MTHSSVLLRRFINAIFVLSMVSICSRNTEAMEKMVLKLDGIPGESTISDHGGDIDILSWNWGVSQTMQDTAGENGGALADVKDIVLTKSIDSSTPLLMKAASEGTLISKAELIMIKSGDQSFQSKTILMTDVFISSIQTSVFMGSDRIQERISLHFDTVKVQYQSIDPMGLPDGELITYLWDVLKNTGEIIVTTTPTPTPTETAVPSPTQTPEATPTPFLIPGHEGPILVFDDEETPFVLDNNLIGKTDFDPVEHRSLVIFCNAEKGEAVDWHFYVRKGLGGMKYLGHTGDGNRSALSWSSTSSNGIAKEFRQGPDFNEVYSFRVVRILDGKSSGAEDYFDMEGLVGYNIEGGNPLPLSQPEMPFLNSKRIAIVDDLLGLDELSVSGSVGSDTDPANSRAIQIVWNFDADALSVVDYHVQVRVQDGSYQFLGHTFTGAINYFWWTPNSEFLTDRLFSSGPQDGNLYQFRVIKIPFEGGNESLESGQVLYSVR